MLTGFDSNADLNRRVRSVLPSDAQDVYRLAYNNTLAAGDNPTAADSAAWAAVKIGWDLEAGGWWAPKPKLQRN